jgi:hypothetical protein
VRRPLDGRGQVEPEDGGTTGSQLRSGSGPQPGRGASAQASDRLITSRWIWLVPSKICMTFASRM